MVAVAGLATVPTVTTTETVLPGVTLVGTWTFT
jgi:hypothetical protein